MQDAEGLAFGEAAELYDRVRPAYPDALYAAVLSAVGTARRALEAGAGTGHATAAIARRGITVDAVEPDRRMARVAQERCKALPVRIHDACFEDWQGPPGVFDLVFSAQAWHWLDHRRAAAVAATALRADGLLAVWWTRPRGVEGRVLDRVRDAYGRHAPALASRTSLLVMSTEPDVPPPVSGFSRWRTTSYRWQEAYDAHRYTELILTQGDHRLLPAGQRARLLEAVANVIAAHGDRIEYEFSTDLSVATRPRA
jgi:SAM-dependent methyltransferase